MTTFNKDQQSSQKTVQEEIIRLTLAITEKKKEEQDIKNDIIKEQREIVFVEKALKYLELIQKCKEYKISPNDFTLIHKLPESPPGLKTLANKFSILRKD